MSQKELPELLTLKQACELLQVHPNTLRNWGKNGTLKAVVLDSVGYGVIRKPIY